MMRWPVLLCEKVDAQKRDAMLACWLWLVELGWTLLMTGL
jgi:hypothetical protein